MMTTKERNDHSEEMEKAHSDCSYRNRCRDTWRNCVCKNANLCSDRGRAAGDGTGKEGKDWLYFPSEDKSKPIIIFIRGL